MALQIGTVDGLVYISEEKIRCFVNAIKSFSNGGVNYSLTNNVSIGTAFQRYVDPVYNKKQDEFDLKNIAAPVFTNKGAEQSPARVTYCKKMGLLNFDEKNYTFNLTPVGNAIYKNEITISEYAFLLISKLGVFQDQQYVGHVLTDIASYFIENIFATDVQIKDYFVKKYNDGSIEKTRIDVILGALEEAKLLKKFSLKEGKGYIVSGLDSADVFNDFRKNSSFLAPAEMDSSENYVFYIGDMENGVLDIINDENLSIYEKKYPNLVKYRTNKGNEMLSKMNYETKIEGPLQQIFYGAPGTGKSHVIKEKTAAAEDAGRVFRTTFHPDSDYSTFVGCYKPSMGNNKGEHAILDYEGLVDKFKEYIDATNNNITQASVLLGHDFHDSIVNMLATTTHTIPDLVTEAYKSGSTYDTNVRAGMRVYEENPKSRKEQIVYKFTPQAFTNAYVKAWQTDEPVFLIIEEINRGNCAQIFGDLFQLLDRENGVSEYPIDADTDLSNYLSRALADSTREDFPEGVKEGKKLVLPSNLYIWATMNTSDQSLFPIDSAFKRRWDWQYIPIEDAEKNWKIEVNGHEYDWYEFLKAINKEVFDLTHSEDKQLGYFFAKAKGGKIDADTLVNKVYFYLWTDVFKDYEIDGQKAFRKPNSNDAIAFKEFFKKGEVDEVMAEQVLVNLELNKPTEPTE